MKASRFAVRLAEDRAVAVDLSSRLRQAIGEEAAYRGLSAAGLVALLLAAIDAHDLYDLVLKHGKAR
jgi:hypothetical protein